MPTPTPSAALDAAWRSTSSYDDDMLPLRRQLSDLSELVFSADQERGSTDWFGVSENLKAVAAVENVITGPSFASPSLCGAIDDSEEGFSDLTRLRLGGMVVFTLTWQAFESAVYVHLPKSTQAGADGRDLLERIDRSRQIPLLEEVLTEARTTLDQALPANLDKIKWKPFNDLLEHRHVPAAAAEFARNFRNGVIHGWIPLPVAGLASDDDGSTAQEPELVVFGQMTRLVAILIQLLFSLSFKEDDTIEHDCDEIPAWELLDRFHIP